MGGRLEVIKAGYGVLGSWYTKVNSWESVGKKKKDNPKLQCGERPSITAHGAATRKPLHNRTPAKRRRWTGLRKNGKGGENNWWGRRGVEEKGGKKRYHYSEIPHRLLTWMCQRERFH